MRPARTRTAAPGSPTTSTPAPTGLVFHPPSPFFKRVELEVDLDDGHYHVPLLVSVLVRELPRQLSAAELTPLFSGRSRLVDELAAREDPLGIAGEVALALPERIGSPRSRRTRASGSRRRSSAGRA